MKILKVHNYYTQSGGEDTVFYAETAILRSHGHEVLEYLEFNQKIKEMNQVSVAVQTIWSRTSNHKLGKFLQETRPDLVHFHNTFPLISPSAYYVCQESNIPVVQTLDNQRLICPASTFYRDGDLCLDCLGKTPPYPAILHGCYHNSRLHTAVVASMLTFHRWVGTWLKKVDVFLCSTHFYRELFIKAGLPADKIEVIPHFVGDQPHPDLANRDTGGYALFIGRLDPEKGINTLLEAWRNVNVPLKIRGNGRLENMAKEVVVRNSMDHVEFVGRLDEDGLSKLIRDARFLIMPSEGYYETFGMVIIEAYSLGVPVIASNIGVVPEIVTDYQTGRLFEPGNPLDLADKVKWMWYRPEELVRMGQNAYFEYQQKYTTARAYRLLHDMYRRAISNKRK